MKTKLMFIFLGHLVLLSLQWHLPSLNAAESALTGDDSPKPFVNSLAMKMVPIPAGAFEMGEDWIGPWAEYHARMAAAVSAKIKPGTWKGGEIDESPRHLVTISRPFFMASCEVTNLQYEMFDPAHRKLRTERNPGDHDAVGNVSWLDARAFCQRLSQNEGRPYRLPTEAEWEYACRAGTESFFHTGDSLPDAIFKRNTRRVGQTRPNAWGLYDMHGGVEEWCHDWYGPYPEEPQTDPIGPATGRVKTLRGGYTAELEVDWPCLHLSQPYLRSANRAGNIPTFRHEYYGFRVVMAEPPASEPLPPETPLWASDVEQTPYDWPNGPDPEEPFFADILEFAHPPERKDDVPFYAINHVPTITWCENGDMLTIWWTTVKDGGRTSAILASRLRAGNEQYDPPSLFFAAPDRCLHGSSLFHDGQGRIIWLQNIAPGGAWNTAPLTVSFSVDNGVTWSDPKIALPEVRSGQPAHMVMTRDHNGVLWQTGDHYQTDKALTGNCGATALFRSDDRGLTWNKVTRLQWQLENLGKAGKTGGAIAGPHGVAVMLRDGNLLGFGRRANIEGNLIQSLSKDGGRSWTYSRSEFPCIRGGQRPSLLRLREGPIMFVAYTGPQTIPGHGKIASFEQPLTLAKSLGGMTFTDAAGKEYTGYGLYAAVSYDEGQTWKTRKLITPGGPRRVMFGGAHHHHFVMDDTHAETGGYSYATQTPDGVIHLITSNLHYRFNLKWLQTPATL